MRVKPFLTGAQWEKIKPLLPEFSGMGRKPIDNRLVLEGILRMLRTGARWRDIPKPYPSGTTCWRRFSQWEEEGVWEKAWRAFLAELDAKKAVDWSEAFIDGSFAPAKKGATAPEKPSVARVQSGWWWWTAKVFLSEAKLPARLPGR